MRVTINYFGQLEQLSGRPSEERECREGISLLEVLDALAGQYGADFKTMVMDAAGRPRSSLLIVVNGEVANAATAVEVGDGDEVTLLPPIAGG
jgi:MoaD family protein